MVDLRITGKITRSGIDAMFMPPARLNARPGQRPRWPSVVPRPGSYQFPHDIGVDRMLSSAAIDKLFYFSDLDDAVQSSLA